MFLKIMTTLFICQITANIHAVTSKPMTISLWHRLTPPEGEVLKKILRQVERKHSINISAEFVQDPALTLEKAHTIGKLPDILLGPGDLIGLAKRFNFSKTSSPKNQGDPIAWQPEKIRQSVPLFQGNHLVLFFNKKLIPNPPTEFENIENLAKKHPKKWLFTWNDKEPYYLWPFLSPFGSKPIDDNGNPNLDSIEFKKALAFYKGLSSKKLLKPNCDHSCARKTFFEEDALFFMSGAWDYIDTKNKLKDDLGTMPLFTINKIPMKPLTTGWALFFPNDSLRGSKSLFLKEITSALLSENSQNALSKFGLLPLSKKLPGEQSLFKQAYLKQLETAAPIQWPNRMTALWHVLKKGVTLSSNSQIPLDQLGPHLQKLASESFRETRREDK